MQVDPYYAKNFARIISSGMLTMHTQFTIIKSQSKPGLRYIKMCMIAVMAHLGVKVDGDEEVSGVPE